MTLKTRQGQDSLVGPAAPADTYTFKWKKKKTKEEGGEEEEEGRLKEGPKNLAKPAHTTHMA